MACIRNALDASSMMFLSTDMVHFNTQGHLMRCETDSEQKSEQ